MEKHFASKILSLYTDGGGEYKSLDSYLSLQDIQHLSTPPYTPQRVALAERRHRHIVETARTPLHEASLPPQFWSFACHHTVYLINCLPTSYLDNQSPFQRLLRKSPNYNSLRIFGCLSDAWLKPYAKNKLESKSAPCVYLGFSLSHHCHQCFDPISAKVYLSRDVRFVEDVFPFKTLFSNIAIKSTHLEWATPIMPSSSDPTPKLPIVTDLPTPLEIAAHTIIDFPLPSASSQAQSEDNSNSQSLSDNA